MQRKKYIKYLCCFIIFLIVISVFNIVHATDIVTAMNSSLSSVGNKTSGSSIVYLLSRAFTAIQFIGTGISIIIITRLGITYMLSSVEEKAQIKQRAVPILMGTFVLVATVNILKLIQVFVTN